MAARKCIHQRILVRGACVDGSSGDIDCGVDVVVGAVIGHGSGDAGAEGGTRGGIGADVETDLLFYATELQILKVQR